jgi:hypothetical protein
MVQLFFVWLGGFNHEFLALKKKAMLNWPAYKEHRPTIARLLALLQDALTRY